jgi:hypothetical protein
MQQAFLRVAALLALLAVMAASGGCVALYTVSRAMERPGDAGEGMGLPLSSPGTVAPTAPAPAIPGVTTPGGDGLPFDPHMAVTPSVSVPGAADTLAGTARASNATPPQIPVRTDTPPAAGPPPHDEIRRPTLPATPL